MNHPILLAFFYRYLAPLIAYHGFDNRRVHALFSFADLAVYFSTRTVVHGVHAWRRSLAIPFGRVEIGIAKSVLSHLPYGNVTTIIAFERVLATNTTVCISNHIRCGDQIDLIAVIANPCIA